MQELCRVWRDAILLVRAMEDRAELDLCRNMVSAENTTVCRLVASIAGMQQRVKLRETGPMQQQFVDRVGILDAILDRANLENFVVVNENRSLSTSAGHAHQCHGFFVTVRSVPCLC